METVLVKKYVISSDPDELRGSLAHLKDRLGLIPYKYRAEWNKRIEILESELRTLILGGQSND